MSGDNRCQKCGRFQKIEHLIYTMVAPDSHLTREEWEIICWKCDGRLICPPGTKNKYVAPDLVFGVAIEDALS